MLRGLHTAGAIQAEVSWDDYAVPWASVGQLHASEFEEGEDVEDCRARDGACQPYVGEAAVKASAAAPLPQISDPDVALCMSLFRNMGIPAEGYSFFMSRDQGSGRVEVTTAPEQDPVTVATNLPSADTEILTGPGAHCIAQDGLVVEATGTPAIVD